MIVALALTGAGETELTMILLDILYSFIVDQAKPLLNMQTLLVVTFFSAHPSCSVWRGPLQAQAHGCCFQLLC